MGIFYLGLRGKQKDIILSSTVQNGEKIYSRWRQEEEQRHGSIKSGPNLRITQPRVAESGYLISQIHKGCLR